MKKFFTFISALLLALFLWAQNPTSDFPFYFYDESSASYYDVSSKYLANSNRAVINEDYDDFDLILYKNKYKKVHSLVFKYENGKAPSASSIKSRLKEYQDVFKIYDEKIDSDQSSDYSIVVIFLENNNNLIAYAVYDRN